MNLIKWILFPGVMLCPRIGGDDGGGGGSGDNSAAEEARKAELRKRIDVLYGVDESDPEALAARQAMDAENTTLGDSTRAYHTDQLGRTYTKAERDTRFKLARQGLLGGSEDVYQQGEVKSDRDLGATRVDQAVRGAVAGLKNQREQERLNAVNLVNSGAGDSAVSAAQAGLRNSFDVANSAQRQNLFADLFANASDAVASGVNADREAALLGRYKSRLATFFPNPGSSSGRVTPSE